MASSAFNGHLLWCVVVVCFVVGQYQAEAYRYGYRYRYSGGSYDYDGGTLTYWELVGIVVGTVLGVLFLVIGIFVCKIVCCSKSTPASSTNNMEIGPNLTASNPLYNESEGVTSYPAAGPPSYENAVPEKQ